MSMVDLVIAIKYAPHITSDLFRMDKKQLLQHVRNDLTALKFPHPGENNLHLTGVDGVELLWTTRKKSGC